MKKFLSVAVAVALVALCSSAYAGQIWTDGNGDGLPDGGAAIVAPPSSNVTVGVWIDAQSFTWTNFLAYIEWSGQCISYVSASYVISGGSNFPIDNFSHPRGIGFGGSGYTQGGVDHIGNVTLHVNTPVNCCLTPIIDVYNPYYVFSQLGAGSNYMFFSTNPGSCVGDGPQTGACCFCDGSCQDGLTAEECVAAEGSYVGDGSECATAFCDVPGPVVCCFPDGTCSDILGICDCADAGGVIVFAFGCQPGICQPFEACCFPNGDCEEHRVGNCEPGSVPQGPGTGCVPNSCEPEFPTEACCFPDGSCINGPVGECPPGSTPVEGRCELFVCPPPIGACCLPTGECVDATIPECIAMGGYWYGPETCAGGFTCKTSVESKSWGGIKALFR